MGSSHGQQTIQGACVSETAVHDHGRRLNQREFRPMAEVAFRPACQLSEYKGKGASASREEEEEEEGNKIVDRKRRRRRRREIELWRRKRSEKKILEEEIAGGDEKLEYC